MSGVDMSREMWLMVDDYPFTPPPEGVLSNFQDPEPFAHHPLTIASTTCIILLLLASGTRFYAKARVIKKITLDDYFYCISLPLLLFVLSSNIILDQSASYNHHAWDLQIKSITKLVLALAFASQLLVLPVASLFIKLTLFCQLILAFRPITWLRRSCYAGMAATSTYYLTTVIVSMDACHPRGGSDRVLFLMGLAGSACGGKKGVTMRLNLASGIFNVLSDLYILCLPLPAVSLLKVSVRRKVGVYMIFSTGGLACVASIIALAYRCKMWGSVDVLLEAIPAIMTNQIELTVGLIVCCIPPSSKLLRRLFARRFPSVLGSGEIESEGPHRHMPQIIAKKHQPGGLSEIDAMKTFGTMVAENEA
ncbi:hypothetical protein M011DRAFT_134770 [Sporormia fimetaria CBS 119925]|uniref:Rhodopsin domain-containing protein n=1 Tax=Sporormia fimetaria CBS 119925 TaxID=1340428 RepID=A0A6A6V9D0_9PLEO|nr:hypothetical protein M011DRAFT_134770 [Sporormia fimetaria CBS 119925]